MRVRAALPALLLVLSALAPRPAVADCAGLAWTESKLYMGRTLSGGRTVDDAALKNFIHDTIVPAFPDGFTILDADGYWFSSTTNRTIEERSVMFVVAHPPGPEAEQALRRIADAYIARFEQSAVLRTSQPVCAEFYEKK